MNRQSVTANDSAQADIHAAIQQMQAGSHSAADLEVLRQAIVAGQITVAGGDRAVAIGGNAEGAVIVTGTGNTIAVDGPSAVALRELLADIKELKAHGHSRAMQDPREGENRHRMLARVRRTWIDGYLDDSLHGAAMQILGLKERPDAVPNRWGMVLQQLDHPARTLAPSMSIAEVFDDMDGEVLVLGEPGSGKTTVLLELARTLLDRAERSETPPIPVVFPLAPWSAKQAPITEWLVAELNERYDVPRSIGRGWVNDDRILPLLDGLDEVAADHRAACVTAINVYREGRTKALPGLVVTSRVCDYDALTTRLRLQGAVFLQPLRADQIDAYLADSNELVGLRAALQGDGALRELATSPLLLSTMTLAYQGLAAESLLASGTTEERRVQLFATYVEQMFARRGVDTHYSRQQTLRWLGWLANVLTRQAQTTVYLESLQPDWLPTAATRRWYAVVDRLGSALLIGAVVALLVRPVAGEWEGALLISLICGLAAALLGGARAPHAGLLRGGWPIRLRAALGGLAGGLLGAGSIAALASDILPTIWVIEFGLVMGSTVFGMAYVLSAGRQQNLRAAARTAVLLGLVGGASGATLGGLVGFGVLAIMAESAWQVIKALSLTLVRDGPAATFELSGPMGIFGGFGLVYGLAIGLLGSAVASLPDQSGTPSGSLRRDRGMVVSSVAGSALLLGVLTGGVTVLLQLSRSDALLGVGVGVAGAALGAFVGGVAGGPGVRARRVALVEPMCWSTPTAVRAGLKGLLFGLLWGTIGLGTIFGLLGLAFQTADEEFLQKLDPTAFSGPQGPLILGGSVASAGGVATGLLFGLVWGILRGLDVAEVEPSPVPGQGLRRSARRAILMGLGSYVAMALLIMAASLLGGAVPGLFPDIWTVVVGSVLLAVPFGVGGALAHGGYACLSHVALRIVLWRIDNLPPDTIRFLDYATERIFLRKVGGGYIFVHRLLQEYFASLEPEQPQTRLPRMRQGS